MFEVRPICFWIWIQELKKNFAALCDGPFYHNLRHISGERENFIRHQHISKQVAQLSQRDRAAGWVSNGQKWKTGTERQYLRTMYIGLYSTTATYMASKEIEIGEKTQNKGCYAV